MFIIKIKFHGPTQALTEIVMNLFVGNFKFITSAY